MKKRASLVDINFVDEQVSVFSHIAKWIAIYGVIFVILTSAVVLSSTVWNLVLDRQVVALDKQIAQRLEKINSYAQFEKNFLVVQDKLIQYQDTLNQERMNDLLPKLTTVTPPGVTMKEMTITTTLVTIGGTAITQNDLANFIQNIMLIEKETFDDGQRVEFVNLSINQINRLSGNQLGFEFNIQFDYQFIES